MTTETHITAGLLAAAGARPGARPGARTAATCARTSFASYAPAVHQVSSHQTTWIKGVAGEPTTFMVLDAKNRPTRPLSELSP